jgi:hypothetical protein
MIFPTLDLSKEEKAARRKWKYEAPKFDCAAFFNFMFFLFSFSFLLRSQLAEEKGRKE